MHVTKLVVKFIDDKTAILDDLFHDMPVTKNFKIKTFHFR